MAGYSATDRSPSWQNRKAFIQELTSTQSLDELIEPSSWNEVIQEVESFLEFWKLYYCGIESAPKP